MGINLTEISQKVLDTVGNAANIFRKMYDLHYNPTPMDVPMEYVDENGVRRTTNVPNRSKLEADFEAWKNGFEQNVVFKVEGQNTFFYPIIIGTTYQPFHFFVSRDSVHWDSDVYGNWYGRMMCEIVGFATHHGHGADFRGIVTNTNNIRKFLARAYEYYELGQIVLYLRGGTTYRFRGRYCNLLNYSAQPKESIITIDSDGNTRGIRFDVVEDGQDTTFVQPCDTNFVQQFTSFSTVIGDLNGVKVIDTQNQ